MKKAALSVRLAGFRSVRKAVLRIAYKGERFPKRETFPFFWGRDSFNENRPL